MMSATTISQWPVQQVSASDAAAEVRIGHVHLRVAELERATRFYRDVLSFKVTYYGPEDGLPPVLLAAGDYHHHIALNTFHSEGGSPPPNGCTGLHHFAIAYPDDLALARAVARIMKCGHPIDDGRDHGKTLSVYLRDLDDNGIELYYDRPRNEWFDAIGRLVIKSEQFDIKQWLQSIWEGPHDVPGRKLRAKAQAA